MDLESLWPLVGVGVGLFVMFQGVRSIPETLRRRRAQRHLDEAGLTTTAQIVKVEPMQRDVNGAAGHPVTFSLQDKAGQQRHVRDASGLGGYLVREGSQVVARYSPDDLDLARVEQIVGPHGAYPVHPDGRVAGLSLGKPLLPLGLGALLAGIFGTVWLTELTGTGDAVGDAAGRLLPLAFLVVGLGMLGYCGYALVRGARQGRPRDDVFGAVTEVWSERSGGGGKNQPQTVYPFTVHFVTRDGREVHARSRVASSWFEPRPQQPVRVRYDRAHPVRFDVREVMVSGAKAVVVVVLLLIGIAFTAVGLLLTVIFVF